MEETADPVALVQSRLLPDPFPRAYDATRARRAVSLKAMRTDEARWRVGFPLFFSLLIRGAASQFWSFTRPLQVMAVNAARSDPPCPEPERVRAAQRREQERAARKKEKRIRRRERREQRSEELRLHEQQGLSSPATSE
jgi:hypothetical protein